MSYVHRQFNTKAPNHLQHIPLQHMLSAKCKQHRTLLDVNPLLYRTLGKMTLFKQHKTKTACE